MIPLTGKEKKSYSEQKFCYICKKELCCDDKKCYKVRDHCHYTKKYRGAAHNIYNLRYKILKEIPEVFHNGSDYDCHFIIKKLVEEYEEHTLNESRREVHNIFYTTQKRT